MDDPSARRSYIEDPSLARFVKGAGTSRRQFLGLAAMAVAGIGVGVSGCGTAQTKQHPGGGGQGRAGAAGETLFVAGFQWGPPTSFNPLGSHPGLPDGGPPAPADLRDPAALQPARRLAAPRAGQGAAGAGRAHHRRPAAGRHEVVRRQRADRRRRGLHLRPGQDQHRLYFSTVWQLRRLRRGDRPAHGDSSSSRPSRTTPAWSGTTSPTR